MLSSVTRGDARSAPIAVGFGDEPNSSIVDVMISSFSKTAIPLNSATSLICSVERSRGGL